MRETKLASPQPLVARGNGSQVAQGWACAVCGNAVVVLEIGEPGARVFCCGEPMVSAAPVSCGSPARTLSADPGMRLGAVYRDEVSGLMVRCIRAGSGSVAVDGRTLLQQPSNRRLDGVPR